MIGSVALILEHDVAGEGDAVVLIHSTVCDRRMWDPQWGQLTKRLRAVRCDLRGFGDTPLPPGPFSNAEDVLALVDRLGLERVALVGASGGGRVALDVVGLRPALVSRLALLSTGLREWNWSEQIREVWAEEERLWDAGDLDGGTELMVRTWISPDAPDEVRDLVRTMQRRAYEVQHAAEQQEPGPGPETRVDVDLETIDAPTLVVCGLHDLPDFVGIAHMLAREIPHATLVELETAHLPNLELPHVTSNLLVDFLQA
jgi:pimeloyl-ACP methyl ester carboxylesterase